MAEYRIYKVAFSTVHLLVLLSVELINELAKGRLMKNVIGYKKETL